MGFTVKIYIMSADIETYHSKLSEDEQDICRVLKQSIEEELTESAGKIWHRHPVWFIDDNPIVGYSKQKKGLRLMFWSGADFDEVALNIKGSKFKDASVYIDDVKSIDRNALTRWLKKAREIQ